MIVAALLLAASQAAPVAPVAAPDDEAVFRAGLGTLLLRSQIEQALFDFPILRGQMTRIGLVETCAIANETVRLAVAENEGTFRPMLIAAMRSQIPPEAFAARGWGTLQGTLTPYHLRVENVLNRDAAPIYERARTFALTRFREEAARAPTITGPWEDIFADWELRKNIAVRTACSAYRTNDPAHFKLPFNQFYQRKEMH